LSQNFKLEKRFFEVREPFDEPAVEAFEMTDARREEAAAGDPCVGNVLVLDSTGDTSGLAAGVVEGCVEFDADSAVLVLVCASDAEVSTVWPAG
jgi:hypothetical protein